MTKENRGNRQLLECTDCKYNWSDGCKMKEAMTEEHREWFIKEKISGCYYYDSIKSA